MMESPTANAPNTGDTRPVGYTFTTKSNVPVCVRFDTGVYDRS